MTPNTYSDFYKGHFMNTPPSFDCERFDFCKGRMNFFIEANGFEVWKFVINCLFIPSSCINNKVENKLDKSLDRRR